MWKFIDALVVGGIELFIAVTIVRTAIGIILRVFGQ
jgi:hypothetical protein